MSDKHESYYLFFSRLIQFLKFTRPVAWRPKRTRTLHLFFRASTEAGEKVEKFFFESYDRPMILRCSAAIVSAVIFLGCPAKTAPVTPMDQQAIRDRANATHEDLKKEEKKSEERKQEGQ